MHRRVFVKDGALALVTLGLSPSFLCRATFAAELPGARKGKVLIYLFQRGTADGISMVVPHGEPAYYAARPSIAIPRPTSGSTDAAIDLDGFFGLHPALQPFARWAVPAPRGRTSTRPRVDHRLPCGVRRRAGHASGGRGSLDRFPGL